MTFVSATMLAALLALSGCVTIGNPAPAGQPPQSGQASGQAQQPGSSGQAQGGQAAAAAQSAAPAERNIRGGTIPQFVRDAVKNAPEDAVVGIGTAKMSSLSQSRVQAATRGRAEISRQIITFMKDMITDYTAGSEVDPSAALAYQEVVSNALSQSAMSGAAVVDEDQTAGGDYWVVVMMPRDGAAKEVNQAAAAAKLKVPQMAAFDAMKRMDERIDKLTGQEIQVQDR
jgi:hypothetical protein